MLTMIKYSKKFKIPAVPNKTTKCNLCKKDNIDQGGHCKMAALVINAGYLEIEWQWLCEKCYWKAQNAISKCKK